MVDDYLPIDRVRTRRSLWCLIFVDLVVAFSLGGISLSKYLKWLDQAKIDPESKCVTLFNLGEVDSVKVYILRVSLACASKIPTAGLNIWASLKKNNINHPHKCVIILFATYFLVTFPMGMFSIIVLFHCDEWNPIFMLDGHFQAFVLCANAFLLTLFHNGLWNVPPIYVPPGSNIVEEEEPIPPDQHPYLLEEKQVIEGKSGSENKL